MMKPSIKTDPASDSAAVAVAYRDGARPSDKLRQLREVLFETSVVLSAGLAITIIALIFIFVAREALPLLWNRDIQREANLNLLFRAQHYGTPDNPFPYVWQPVSTEPKYSLMPLMLGTLKTALIAMLFATPLALAAALFTAEFAPARGRELIKPLIELLAGIPSVVLGFFALIVLATVLQQLFNFDFRLNAIVAGVALGIAIIPVIFTVAEDAITAVPKSYREASLALGASSWQTAWRTVIPAALPGLFAALVLGFGRVMGETMIVIMASGNAAITSWNFTESVRTLSATIAAELAEVVFGSAHYRVLYFIGTLLFAVTFVLNLVGDFVINRLKQRLLGSAR